MEGDGSGGPVRFSRWRAAGVQRGRWMRWCGGERKSANLESNIQKGRREGPCARWLPTSYCRFLRDNTHLRCRAGRKSEGDAGADAFEYPRDLAVDRKSLLLSWVMPHGLLAGSVLETKRGKPIRWRQLLPAQPTLPIHTFPRKLPRSPYLRGEGREEDSLVR